MPDRPGYQAAYYAANGAKIRARIAARYAADGEAKRAYNRARYAAKRDEIRAKAAAFRQANPEDAIARTAAWRKANPEKRQVQARTDSHRRRVRIRGGEIEQFTDLEIFDRDGWVCQLCDEPIDRQLRNPDPFSVSLDHVVPVSKGGNHTRANAQAAHLLCNQRKSDRLTIEQGSAA